MAQDTSIRRWFVALLTAISVGAFAIPAHAQLTFNASTFPGEGQSISKGDINEDGHLDLWVVNGNNFSSSVLLNDGAGGFLGPFSTVTSAFFPRTGAMADLNGDGHLDLVGPDGGIVYIRFGDGAGGFSASTGFTINSRGDQIAAAADCSGDGIIDILTAGGRGGNAENIHCLPGNGNGTFGASIASPGTAEVSPSVKAGDVDNDGDLDLVTLSNSLDSFRVWLNDGSGTFSFASHTGTGQPTRKLAVGDLNGDGMADVVYGTSPGNPSSAFVRVFSRPAAAPSPSTARWSLALQSGASRPRTWTPMGLSTCCWVLAAAESRPTPPRC